jgi:hypothetical protein
VSTTDTKPIRSRRLPLPPNFLRLLLLSNGILDLPNLDRIATFHAIGRIITGFVDLTPISVSLEDPITGIIGTTETVETAGTTGTTGTTETTETIETIGTIEIMGSIVTTIDHLAVNSPFARRPQLASILTGLQLTQSMIRIVLFIKAI